jgi:hypothetical protein
MFFDTVLKPTIPFWIDQYYTNIFTMLMQSLSPPLLKEKILMTTILDHVSIVKYLLDISIVNNITHFLIMQE